MRTIAQISDLHFGKVSRHVLENLKSSLNSLSPDVLVVTGDVTQRCKREQYEAASEFLGEFDQPVLAVPGNHDIHPYWKPLSRVSRPFSRYREYISDDLEPTYVDDEIGVFGFNTTTPFRVTEGWVRRCHIRSLERRIEAAGELPFKLVFMHHSLLPPMVGMPPSLRGMAKGIESFRRQGVDLVLAVHSHKSRIEESVKEFYSGRTKRILMAEASTAISSRVREDNGYNVFRIDGESLSFTKMTHDRDRFVASLTSRFARTEEGWTSEETTQSPEAAGLAVPGQAVTI